MEKRVALVLRVLAGALALVVAGVGGVALGQTVAASTTTGSPDTLYTWGANSSGDLGNGTTTSSDTPVEVSLPAGVSATAVAAGSGDGLALTSSGAVYAWGANGDGQLGDGTGGAHTTSDTPVEVSLPAGVRATAVASGAFDGVASTSTGAVYAWGANTFGQLGDGTSGAHTTSDTPVEVSLPAGVRATAVAAGNDFCLALTSTGAVYAWGNNTGRLGNGTTTPTSDTPVEVSLPSGVRATAVAADNQFALASASTGAVYAWGANTLGQLGNGTTTSSDTPVEVSLPSGVSATAVGAGTEYGLALTSTGAVYAWGWNGAGQLGDGTQTNSDTPVKVGLPAGVSARAVAAGSFDGLASTSTGAVYDWGTNGAGELGDGTTTGVSGCEREVGIHGQETILPCSDTPVAVSLPAGVRAIAVVGGSSFNLALTQKKVTPSSKRIYGTTAESTAAKELETEFPGATGKCPGTTGTRPVIVATATHFQDALSSQYLAGYLGTGTLLTPTGSLSTVTKAALKEEGITRVDLVGGPLAVATTVEDQLESLPAYSCGGASAVAPHLTVTRIWGQTQYATAEAIAESVPKNYVASAQFAQAYAGTNAYTGTGMYNDTAGTGSTAPFKSGTLKTAIVASGTEFQDAMAASALGYATHFPILLTSAVPLSSQVTSTIEDLTIQQVIVMGGPLAVYDTATNALETMGVSVLRVAGKNYTDTATQFAKFLLNARTTLGMGWTVDKGAGAGELAVARGNGYTDGLAGAVVTGRNKMALLLTLNPTSVGSSLTAFLKATGNAIDGTSTDKIESLTVLGGPLAVSTAVISQMETDVG